MARVARQPAAASTKAAARPLEALQLRLKAALEATKACEVLMMQSRKGDLRAVFRVTDQPAWLRVLSSYLANEKPEQWYSFFGQAYKLHNGKLMTAWVMFVDAPEGVLLEDAVDGACRCLSSVMAKTDVGDREALFPEDGVISTPWALGPKMLSRVSNTPAPRT